MWPFEGAGHQTDGTHMQGSDAVGVGEAQGDGPFDLGPGDGRMKYHLSEMKYENIGKNHRKMVVEWDLMGFNGI